LCRGLAPFLFAALLLSLVVSACKSGGEGFAIYLPAQNINYEDMDQITLNAVQLADTPLISLDDIVSYSRENHEIELTPTASDRVNSLCTPTIGGEIFIVSVDRKPIYWGAFWPIYSCVYPPDDCVVGWIPLYMNNLFPLNFSANATNDPRSDPEIMTSLERAGKLN
jgi:hypothetical protein